MDDRVGALIAPGSPVSLWTGTVTQVQPLMVDDRPVMPPGHWAPLLGDRVLMAAQGGTSWCLQALAPWTRPAQVTVTATSVAGKPGYLLASANGQSFELPYTGTYAVNDIVMVDWSTTVGRVYTKVASQSGTAPTPAPGGGGSTQTRTFRAVQAASWRYGAWDHSKVYQYRYSSEAISTGAWCYGGEPRQAVGSGAISSARIFLPRVRGGSNYAPPGQTAHLYAHGSDRLPGGDVARVGSPVNIQVPRGEAWYPIPVSLATAALAGGISVAGGPEYVVFAGLAMTSDDGTPVSGPMSGALELTWV